MSGTPRLDSPFLYPALPSAPRTAQTCTRVQNGSQPTYGWYRRSVPSMQLPQTDTTDGIADTSQPWQPKPANHDFFTQPTQVSPERPRPKSDCPDRRQPARDNLAYPSHNSRFDTLPSWNVRHLAAPRSVGPTLSTKNNSARQFNRPVNFTNVSTTRPFTVACDESKAAKLFSTFARSGHSARCSQRYTEDKSTTVYQEACQSVSRRHL